MNQRQYIKEIIQRSCLPPEARKRLKNDLEHEINAALERGESIEQIIERMGEPDDVAADLYESFADIAVRPFKEYKSKRTLFGLPLVHIIRPSYSPAVPIARAARVRMVNMGGRYNHFGLPIARGIFAYGPKAKGILAVGNFSAGFIAIGNICTGIISVGNISAGFFTLGNIALALLITIGNVAAGLLSVGNMAVGYASAGNFAIGEYAIGNEVMGANVFSISNLSAQLDQIKSFFSGLDTSAWVKAFYGIVEKALEALNDPISAIPFCIAFSFVLMSVIILLYVIPKRLLGNR